MVIGYLYQGYLQNSFTFFPIWRIIFNRYWVFVCDDEITLEMHSGTYCEILWMHLMLWDFMFKNGDINILVLSSFILRTNWHPLMHTSASVGDVGSSTKCQETQMEFYPPWCQVICTYLRIDPTLWTASATVQIKTQS